MIWSTHISETNKLESGRVSCINQITTLQIILEQSLEWKPPLYVNLITYKKAFDSVDRQTRLLKHYRVPAKITNIIRNSYEEITYRMIAFQVQTGMRQGCLLCPLLFLLARDQVMKMGRTDADVKTWIGKARAPLHQLKNVWGPSELPHSTMIGIFNSTVRPVLCTVQRPGGQWSVP